jgi:ribosomal protein S18 acetylase RimI-like enzyme
LCFPPPSRIVASQSVVSRNRKQLETSSSFIIILKPTANITMVKSKVLKQLRKKVDKADRLEDPLSLIEKEKSSLKFEVERSKEDPEQSVTLRNLAVECLSSAYLSDDLLKQCLDLFERNMGDLYRNSSWGLDMVKKAEELQHRKARFLLAFASDENNDKELASFAHFRFDYDDDEEPTCTVLYVYEIHVESNYRRKGLGRRVMAILESVARQAEMQKVILTVFKKNESAMNFYIDSLGYRIDEYSPSKFGEPADYEILSKSVDH